MGLNLIILKKNELKRITGIELQGLIDKIEKS